ncbi:MAG: exosortase/archaeosortase family protein [Nanoarchaeota archaeon]|nr:exosortase/archaeosortase family protein [Nanoarchaeota archaeon]
MKIGKNFIWRFIIFIFLLLIAISLWFATFLNIHYVWAMRASFFFLKIFKLAVISCLLFFFIIWSKIKKFNDWKINWKQIVIFSILALLCFFGSFYTQSDMSLIVSEGVKIKDSNLNFDGGRFLAFNIVSDTHLALNKPFISGNEYDSVFLKKTIYLEELKNKEYFVKWHGFWRDANGNNELDEDISILLFVNNDSFDITNKYSSLNSEEIFEFKLNISNDALLQGKNELILQVKSNKENNDDIIIISQNVYVEGSSFITSDEGINWQEKQEEFLWYVVTDNNAFFTLLFKLGFIFRILGIISLFIAVFGLKFSKFIIKNSYKELFFSTIFAYWIYGFSEFIKTKWYFFSNIVAKAIFFLFKITGFKAFINLKAEIPRVGIQGFVAGVYDVCSGVESIGFFTLAYFMLIVIHWNRIKIWKALLLYIPGVVGIFMLNVLRVYILIILGAKWSSDFALNAFHTNASMVFSIIYFLLFLSLALKFMEIKKKHK